MICPTDKKFGGATLPTLTDPASATDILKDKEAIDGNGDKITGTLVPENSDIAKIGQNATTSYEKGKPTFQACMLPERFEISLPYVTNYSNMFGTESSYLSSAWGAKEIIIHGALTPIITSIQSMFGRGVEGQGYWGKGINLESITLDFNTAGVTNFSGFFRNEPRNKLKEIICNFDFTSATSVGTNFLNVSLNGLTYLRFVANTLSVSASISGAPNLDTDSLVSIINGLNETATGQTLTLHATAKANLELITGTVSLDETETYHIFIPDEQGTTTLLDFATNTKGWTIA